MRFILNNDVLVIYLNNFYLKGINLNDSDKLEKYLSELFKKLKNRYGVNLEGYYETEIYIDKNYGAIVEMVQEDSEYYMYLENEIDTRITIHDDIFLYEIDDVLDIKNLINDYQLYKYEDKFYLRINDEISNEKMAILLEHVRNICYCNSFINKFKCLIY